MNEVVRFLTGTDVCKGLDATEVAEIAKACEPARFKAGTAIVTEDSRERDLYVIMSGRVTITLSHPTSRYKEGAITDCLPGQVFGELGFIDGARRSTFVVAMEDVEAVRLTWQNFLQLNQSNARLGYQFIYNLALVIAERLRDTTMFCSNLWRMRSTGEDP